MYCEKCGAKINEVDNYCHQCGYHFQRLNQKMTYDTKPKKLDNKSMIKAVVVLCLAIAVGFIILFCVNYSKKHSPDYLFVNSWYRESTGKRIEFLSTADSKISYTKDVDNELSDIIGDYTIEGTILIFKSTKGKVSYYTFREMNDENIEKGLYSFDKYEWYVSEKYLYFGGKLYKSDKYFWDTYNEYED